MDKFLLKLSPAAVRDLDRLEEGLARDILGKLSTLAGNPFPDGKRIKKIKGERSAYYRLRVNKYRVFYSIEGREVAVLRIVGKKDVERFVKNL